MFKFFSGVVFGIVLATVGVQGVMNMFNKAVPVAEKSVDTVKQTAKEYAKPN